VKEDDYFEEKKEKGEIGRFGHIICKMWIMWTRGWWYTINSLS